jgi:hypothetical protein
MVPKTAEGQRRGKNIFEKVTVSTFGRGKSSMDRSTLAGTAGSPPIRELASTQMWQRPITQASGVSQSWNSPDPQNFLSEGYMRQRKQHLQHIRNKNQSVEDNYLPM